MTQDADVQRSSHADSTFDLRLLEIKMPLGPRGGKREHREHEGGSSDLTAAQVELVDRLAGSDRAVR